MLTVNVSSNYKKLSRSLDQVGRKQLPFAFAKTLNETMKAVDKYTAARTYPRAFDARNRAFFRAAMFTGSAVKRATGDLWGDRGRTMPSSHKIVPTATGDLWGDRGLIAPFYSPSSINFSMSSNDGVSRLSV